MLSYAAVYDVARSIDPAMVLLAHEGSKRYNSRWFLSSGRTSGRAIARPGQPHTRVRVTRAN